jgi:hypothetical protein
MELKFWINLCSHKAKKANSEHPVLGKILVAKSQRNYEQCNSLRPTDNDFRMVNVTPGHSSHTKHRQK